MRGAALVSGSAHAPYITSESSSSSSSSSDSAINPKHGAPPGTSPPRNFNTKCMVESCCIPYDANVRSSSNCFPSYITRFCSTVFPSFYCICSLSCRTVVCPDGVKSIVFPVNVLTLMF
eukprot:89474_1